MANESAQESVTVATLRDLRARITPLQRDILDMVWMHVRDKKTGIPERPLFRKYREETVKQEATALGDYILRSGHEDNQMRYNIGFVGIFLTTDGPRLETLVKRYLVYLKERFEADPDIEKISSKDLAKLNPPLTESELNELQVITYRANGAFASSFGGSTAEEWLISIRTNVVELDHVTDWDDYISKEVLKIYNWRQSDRAMSVWNGVDNPFPNQFSLHRSASKEAANMLDLAFIDDEPLRRILDADWLEANRLIQVKAWKSIMIMCGGILEGLLLWRLESTLADQDSGKYEDKMLGALVEECKKKGLLKKEDEALTGWARDYRNVIHPANQKKSGKILEESHAMIALNLVKVVASSFRS